MGFLVEGIPALSQSAKEFVLQRPREARLAVAVALETAAAQRETEDSRTAGVPERLRPFGRAPIPGRGHYRRFGGRGSARGIAHHGL